jgi:predicted deacylase
LAQLTGLALIGLLTLQSRQWAGLSAPVEAASEDTPTLTPSAKPSITPYTSPAVVTVPHLPTSTTPATRRPRPTASLTPSATPLPDNPLVIGHSVARRPLEVYRFGQGPSERMIISGIHGGYEWNTIALADELIAYLDEHPDFVPPEVTLFILRSLNPDGEARARTVDGRVNDNGVDLNRNWPALWQADWPRDGCWRYRPTTGGARAGSEPETRALIDFLLDSQVTALINYHSAALGIFPGGQPPDPDSLRLAEAVAEVSDYPYPPIDTGCQFTGQLIDWASAHGIAALDIELTNHRDTDFEQNLAILSVLLNWR